MSAAACLSRLAVSGAPSISLRARKELLEGERPNLGRIRPPPWDKVQQLHRSIIKGVQGIDSRCNGIDEVHLPRHQFRGDMQVVVPIGRFPRSEPAFDRNPSALPQFLAHGLCDLIPGDDALPESAFGPVAGFVPVGLDCCKREGREGLAGGCLFNFEVASDASRHADTRVLLSRQHGSVRGAVPEAGFGCGLDRGRTILGRGGLAVGTYLRRFAGALRLSHIANFLGEHCLLDHDGFSDRLIIEGGDVSVAADNLNARRNGQSCHAAGKNECCRSMANSAGSVCTLMPVVRSEESGRAGRPAPGYSRIPGSGNGQFG